MKKKYFFFIFLIILSFSNKVFSKNKIQTNSFGCNYQVSKNFLENYEKSKIKLIEVDINNYRKWTKNNIKILTNNSRFIADKFKKRFNSIVKVEYENDIKCIFKASIRHSGDAKDHIAIKGNSIIQSLDITLEEGNIKGITKFKLFKPDVRGNINDVIILTEILRHFGYLSPRSFQVHARVNETFSLMLFQEKAEKELLEYNKRREGPILESDQKFFFKLVEKIPLDNQSNWSVGLPFLQDKAMQAMISKTTNSKLISRSPEHKEIFLKSLDQLNSIYLYWNNRFKDNKNNFFFFDYDLDNNLLALFNEENTLKLDSFNVLMQSANSQHGLSLSNRKFFWNSIENFFEPIYYDANPEIDRDFPSTTLNLMRYPISEFYFKAFDEVEEKLKSIDKKKLFSQALINGLNISESRFNKKIEKIYYNLTKIKQSYINNYNQDLLEHNKFKKIENIKKKFNNTISEIDPDIFILGYDYRKKQFNECKVFFNNCNNVILKDEEMIKLLDGDLVKNNFNYIYLNQSNNLDPFNLKGSYNSKKIDNTELFYEDGINVFIDKDNKKIELFQKKLGARAYFKNGALKNYKIIFHGMDNTSIRHNKNILPNNYPINKSNLTGCISFIGLNLLNLDIHALNSSCEDTVNFINVEGQIKKIIIENSYSDALDIDFSNISIDEIEILDAGNDCTDFSSGKYNIKKLNLKNCGDKGISVGEKSSIHIIDAKIKKAVIGVASKDSSITVIKKISSENTKTCLAAYNKKPEFYGGILEADNFNCVDFTNKIETDKFSKVSIMN